MQRYRNEKLYIIIKATPLQGGIGQKSYRQIQLCSAVFEGQYHFLQGLAINSTAGYPVKVKFFTLAIGAGTFQKCKFTGIPAAATAVISAHAGQKLGPAILAQVIISFTDVFAAIDTYCRPKKLV